MKTMYKVYEWNPHIEEFQVVKDTGKTVSYSVKKLMIGEFYSQTDNLLERKEKKETDWYKYCETKQEAKDWLLEKAKAARQETVEKLQRQSDAIAEILEIEV